MYKPIVSSLTTRVSDNFLDDTGVQRFIPLKNSLQGFGLQVTQASECLTALLNDDHDMVQLLLNKQANDRKKGEKLDIKHHENVELLLKEYSRQLHNLSQEISNMIKQIEGSNDFA
eukprot:CAMPEP_0172519682 /NCGR_PEP_ID=MMETSP1066-20121228/291564_1 /TAXON_ID=671091 /ORGANISM="Coscinodiscus wailesii, Strain CCMP2513" /LENGTH=115 /DNA_ID=CAMNT_0013302315 /DNA_START=892 /DNA_END=1239 /DNA_ORIENTATION=-